jgi:hypothetical protein
MKYCHVRKMSRGGRSPGQHFSWTVKTLTIELPPSCRMSQRPPKVVDACAQSVNFSNLWHAYDSNWKPHGRTGQERGVLVCMCECVGGRGEGKGQLVIKLALESTPTEGEWPVVATPLLSSISEHVEILERTKIWLLVPAAPETKINCAGEGQQQFTQPAD